LNGMPHFFMYVSVGGNCHFSPGLSNLPSGEAANCRSINELPTHGHRNR
jgi:hypothetical protein